MKCTTATIIAFAAASAVAKPTFTADKRALEQCALGTYACTTDDTGIQICNLQGNWELVGPCPSGTACQDLPQNGLELPFCTTAAAAKTKTKKRGNDYDWCSTPGQYTCDGYNAIQVCNTTNALEKAGDCPNGSHCDYINNIPYCVDN